MGVYQPFPIPISGLYEGKGFCVHAILLDSTLYPKNVRESREENQILHRTLVVHHRWLEFQAEQPTVTFPNERGTSFNDLVPVIPLSASLHPRCKRVDALSLGIGGLARVFLSK